MADRVRPTMAMHNLSRGIAALESKRVSTCKVCGLGIFEEQPHHWSTGRVLGLVHDTCIGEAS